jgi:putative alpha-1,2-mannosidase
MSAWDICSSLGFYPLDPVGGCYEIGSPIVRGAKLRLGGPHAETTLEIRVRNYSPDRWRVRRVALNGVELVDWRVRHCDLMKGGVLAFEMFMHTQ